MGVNLRRRWNDLSQTVRLVLAEEALIAAVVAAWWYLH